VKKIMKVQLRVGAALVEWFDECAPAANGNQPGLAVRRKFSLLLTSARSARLG